MMYYTGLPTLAVRKLFAALVLGRGRCSKLFCAEWSNPVNLLDPLERASDFRFG
jgi:hypothetical protein